MQIIIFGAQGIALGAYRAIKIVEPEWEVLCFMVTSLEGNPKRLNRVDVQTIKEVAVLLSRKEISSVKVLICTPENVMDEIEHELSKKGFTNVVRMGSVAWAELQEKAWSGSKQFPVLSDLPVGNVCPKVEVCMAKFWKDKELTEAYVVPEYMVPVQAGAANASVRVADFVDSEGENISAKNGNYSELTALYWFWKHRMENVCDKYYGLAHYRRFLMVDEEDMKRISANSVDVVLPYPMPYEPSIHAHHQRYLSDVEWNAVLQALEELSPEYARTFPQILDGEYMYNYNIVIARGSVLSSYCTWLFPILQRVEEIVDPDGMKVPNRYIGYIGETLATLYFMYNRDCLNIVHDGCRFLK